MSNFSGSKLKRNFASISSKHLFMRVAESIVNKIQSRKNTTLINVSAIAIGFTFQIVDFFLLGFAQSGIVGIIALYVLPFLCLFSVLAFYRENFEFLNKA